MNLTQLISTQEDAKATARNTDRKHSLSTAAFERLKDFFRSDSYAFAQVICGHDALVPELHMPLSYLACGLTDKLIATLDAKGFDSYVTQKLRRELWRRQIDWHTPSGRRALEKLMDFINIRWFRGSYKSSVITHAGGTFMATVDPNVTIKITHATDEKAWEYCGQIGETLVSGNYQDFFPERMPKNPHKDIGQKAITFGGRTVSRPQTTIQASGYLTKDIGGHYDRFLIDDLVMERNATPELLKSTVHPWLSNIEGYYIEAPNIRVRRIHVGTKWDEDDDDAYLTRGKNATQCLTVRVPIEEHEGGEVANITEAGKPTVPQFYSAERIADKKDRVINGEEDGEDVSGAKSWRCNYLLDAYAGGARLFPPSIVDDTERWWDGPLEHPVKERDDKGYFLIRRYIRNPEGKILLDDKGRKRAYLFDPWKDLDRVITVDPAWSDNKHSDNWAVSVVGRDHEGVDLQIETRSDTTGSDGWIEALLDLDEFYRPRVIGFDGGAYQDVVIQNMLKTDKRLRRLRGRMVKVPHNNRSKIARIREGVGERLRRYALLLDPTESGQATRDEMKGYKATGKDVDGILDSLAMAPAVLKTRRSPEEDILAKERAMNSDRAYQRSIHPALGVPMSA